MHFASDNTAPVCAEILAALAEANSAQVSSYGGDPLTAKLTARAKEIFETDLSIFPVGTGTAANALALSNLVHPYGAVLCAEEAHIDSDECGAPEFFTGGAKLLPLPSDDGRITPMQIEKAMARAVDGGVHHVMPEAVSLTQATEWGTVYTAEHVGAIGNACRKRGLHLHMDGARFANALVAEGCSPAELTWKAGVDVLSFGATKNGALAAEAVILFQPGLGRRHRAQAQAGWASLGRKCGSCRRSCWPISKADLWLRNAAHANAMASALGEGLAALPGARLIQDVQANEVFASLPEDLIAALEAEGAVFYRWIDIPGIDNPVIRLVTSFATTKAQVERFLTTAQAIKM